MRIICSIVYVTCIFFFSSRRRHTRLQGDWSSDVCSSDLPGPDRRADEMHGLDARSPQVGFQAQVEVGRIDADKNGWRLLEQALAQLPADRSEERRVGKECRSRWSPYH